MEATRPFQKQAATGDLVLSGATMHLLSEVYQPISSTHNSRERRRRKILLAAFVEPAVADYIKKMGLYKSR